MSTSQGPVSPYKLASVLLQYPTTALFEGMSELDAAAAQTSPRASREAFARFLLWLRATPPTEVGQHYVETFDLRRRCALYLSYYRYGDTRKRGMSMLTFKTAYRAAGLHPSDDELPDYLPMVLDFAALTPRGERLLRAHRADLELLRRALEQAATPYVDVVAAVCALLPRLGRREAGLVRAAWRGRPAARGGRTGAVCPAGVPDRLRNPDVTATGAEVFWWVVLPYLALGVFAVGHVWRWRYDQFGWTSRSTQLQERRMLKWGSPLFHYGTFAAIGGHVIGVLIPERWTKAIGIPENVYRWFSAGAGTLAAVLVIGGVIVLACQAAAGAAGAGHDRADRLCHPDPAADRDPHRHRPHDRDQPARARLRLPHHRGAVVLPRRLALVARARIRGAVERRARPLVLPAGNANGIDYLGRVAVR